MVDLSNYFSERLYLHDWTSPYEPVMKILYELPTSSSVFPVCSWVGRIASPLRIEPRKISINPWMLRPNDIYKVPQTWHSDELADVLVILGRRTTFAITPLPNIEHDVATNLLRCIGFLFLVEDLKRKFP